MPRRLLAVALALATTACVSETREADAAPAADRGALAVLRATGGSTVHGQVRFQEGPEGTTITASVSGLEPGSHGFHVHEVGDCTAPDGSSAGPHWAFVPVPEGTDPGFITGNLGELEADSSGTARQSGRIGGPPLSGDRSVIGRAVVVHADDNDPTETPGGDAGARVACGVIGLIPGTGS